MTSGKTDTTHEQPLVDVSADETNQESNNPIPDINQSEPVQFFISRYYRLQDSSLIHKTQRSGRLAPVFGPPTRASEEKYIEKMLEKDRKLNRD